MYRERTDIGVTTDRHMDVAIKWFETPEDMSHEAEMTNLCQGNAIVLHFNLISIVTFWYFFQVRVWWKWSISTTASPISRFNLRWFSSMQNMTWNFKPQVHFLTFLFDIILFFCSEHFFLPNGRTGLVTSATSESTWESASRTSHWKPIEFHRSRCTFTWISNHWFETNVWEKIITKIEPQISNFERTNTVPKKPNL